METREIISEIIDREWRQFQAVENRGGRAGCQDDRETFKIMRDSQFSVWPRMLLLSYLGDLRSADAAGRNLVAEKYLWMMESTYPEEFEAQKDCLRPKSYGREKMEEKIIGVQVRWMEEYAARYPHLAAGGRAIHTSEDTLCDTSFETYLRGELSTYSAQTLDLYAQWVDSLKSEGRNMSLEIMEQTVRHYGYKDLEAAEAHEAGRKQNKF